jgi:uncharacterized protein YjiS (DUF1127 family)
MTSFTASLADPFTSLFEGLRRRFTRKPSASCARAMHELESLDERMLADIGISREAMQTAVLKYRRCD